MIHSLKNMQAARNVMGWSEFTEADFATHAVFVDKKGEQRFVRKEGGIGEGIFGTEFKPAADILSAFEVLEELIGTPRMIIKLESGPNNKRVTVTLENTVLDQTFTDSKPVESLPLAITNVAIENFNAGGQV